MQKHMIRDSCKEHQLGMSEVHVCSASMALSTTQTHACKTSLPISSQHLFQPNQHCCCAIHRAARGGGSGIKASSSDASAFAASPNVACIARRSTTSDEEQYLNSFIIAVRLGHSKVADQSPSSLEGRRRHNRHIRRGRYRSIMRLHLFLIAIPQLHKPALNLVRNATLSVNEQR